MPTVTGMRKRAFRAQWIGLLSILLGLLSTGLARAQASAALSFTDQNDIVAAAFDNAGNLTLRGNLLQGQSNLAKDPAVQEVYLKDASGNAVAVIQLSGSAPGVMKLRGTLQATAPSGSHSFTLKDGSNTVASISSLGDLYLIGTLSTFNSVPANLTAYPASSSQISLTWTRTGTDETGYRVERSPNGTDSWVQIAIPLTTSYDDTGLTSGTQYFYRVCAYKGAVGSDFTPVASAYTDPAVPASDVPTQLTATPNSSSQISLAWTDNSTRETAFVVERATSVGGPFVPVASLAANTTSFVDFTGLNANTTYTYRIKTFVGQVSLGLSNTVSATTLIGSGIVDCP